jgi:O-antigen/teichoic acid export membrane protein
VALTVRINTVVSAAAAALLWFAGPHALQLLYGDGFMAAVGPLRILLVDTIVSNAARILYQTFSGSGRPEVVTVIEAAAATVSLGSMLVVAPRFGIDGAAACVLMGDILRFVGVLIGLRVVLRVPIPRLILTPADVMTMVGK